MADTMRKRNFRSLWSSLSIFKKHVLQQKYLSWMFSVANKIHPEGQSSASVMPNIYPHIHTKIAMTNSFPCISALSNYSETPKTLDAWKICCNHSKLGTSPFYYRVMCPNDADANTVDADLLCASTVCPDLSLRKLRNITAKYYTFFIHVHWLLQDPKKVR